MPKWGIEMTEGTLSEWNIQEGDRVTRGQVIALIESDKIVNEVQAESDTTLLRVIAIPGEIYPVGALLAVMGSDAADPADVDELIAEFRAPGQTHSVNERAMAEPPSTAPSPATEPASTRPSVIPPDANISPAARQLAEQLRMSLNDIAPSGCRGRITLQDVRQASRPARVIGTGGPVSVASTISALDGHFASIGAKRLAMTQGVDLHNVQGTGKHGRITRQDVTQAAGVSLRRRAAHVVHMSPMRKAIARQLTLSKNTIPHYYLRAQVRLDALDALRKTARSSGGPTPSLNDYFVRAAALALQSVPDVNIQVHGDDIHRFADSDIAVAVATQRGLIAPVVRAAQDLSVSRLSAQLRELIERASSNRLRVDEIEGGSFTVSNLGMFGVELFDAIINPPQGAILAIGAARRTEQQQTLAWLSLSCDHRAIDGAVGGHFLAALRELIENPDRL
jgi:pyruvate dehydrogenase E2 component (dihydrolipoamide acetyltransferase)